MRKDKLSKQNVILYFLGIIPVVWLGLLIAPCLEDPASNIQHAVSYAMRLNDKYPETLCNEYSSRMSFVVDKVNRVDGLSAYPSEGGVYVWIKFEKDSDDVKMCNFILDKALISMVPGSYFGESGRGYARLSLGQCKERLAEAMDRLSEVMRVVKQ